MKGRSANASAHSTTAFNSTVQENSWRTKRQEIYYSLPIVVTGFLTVPSWSVLPGVYATYFGVPLATIASVLLVARIFDGLIDPVVGLLSDWFRQRFGSLKKLVLVAAAVFPVAAFLLYRPITPDIGGTYFLLAFLLFYLTWTVFEIPHFAWGAEIAKTSAAKTSLFSTRISALYLGSILFFLLPYAPIFPTSEIDPNMLGWAAGLSLLSIFPAIYFCARVSGGRRATHAKPVPSSQRRSPFLAGWKVLIYNPPLLMVYAIVLLTTLATSMSFAVLYIYLESVAQSGDAVAQVLGWGVFVGFIAISFWGKIAKRVRRKWLLIAGVLIMALSLTGLSLIPIDDKFALHVSLLIAAHYTGFVTIGLFSAPFISEAADYGNLLHRTDASATCFAANTLLLKVAFGLGGACGLFILDFSGFDTELVEQSDAALLGMNWALSYLPGILLLISLIPAALYPLTRIRHDSIRRRLATRNDPTDKMEVDK